VSPVHLLLPGPQNIHTLSIDKNNGQNIEKVDVLKDVQTTEDKKPGQRSCWAFHVKKPGQ
jgi:hypothetical protein